MALESILSKEQGKTFLMCNEAMVRGALEADVKVVSFYQGAPTSEILDTFNNAQEHCDYKFTVATNEKVALETAAGASMAGLGESSGGRLVYDYEAILQKDLTQLKHMKSLSLPLVLTAAVLWVCNIIWRRLALTWTAILIFIFRNIKIGKRISIKSKKPAPADGASPVADMIARTVSRRKWKGVPEVQPQEQEEKQTTARLVEGSEKSINMVDIASKDDQDANIAARLRRGLQEKKEE